ncbi:MAG: cytochrome C, partial [Trueperaceae bacterium]
MPQYFPPNTNAFVRWALLGGGAFMVALIVALPIYARTMNNAVG